LIPKGKYSISGIDDKIISMYARGMSLRDIEKQVKEMYDVEMSDSLISRIIDKIIPEIKEWQNRTLEPIYPIVYMDAMVFKIKGDAINSVFPQTIVQRCIIHQIRYSMKYVGSKYKKEFMVDLKQVYKAPEKTAAEEALLQLEQKWGERYPMVINSWKNNWVELSTYFQYSKPIRRIIYTTNTIEGFNRQIRKITKTKGGFNSDESLFKLVFLAYRDIAKKWQKSIPNWAEIISQFSIIFADRLNGYIR